MGEEFRGLLRADGRLAEAEGKTLEYKQDLSSPERLTRTLVAFANSAGGSVVVGVADDRSVLGVGDPDGDEHRLSNLILNRIEPRLLPTIERMTVAGKTLLVARVYPATRPPHWVATEGEDEGIYVRLGSSTVKADGPLRAEFRRRADGLVFDTLPNPRAAASGLDDTAIAAAFTGRDLATAKQVLGLVTEEQGRLVPTNGGVLLFGNGREWLFPDAWIQCARFRGVKRQDFDDQLVLRVHLLDAVNKVDEFLRKHAFRAARFEGWKRQDEWSVPLDILRELTVNALTHADYSIPGGPIRVAFFDDRVEIESPGGLLPGLTIELMRAGVSRVRNQVIARVFHEAGLIEQWGSGIPGIYAKAAERGLPEPEVFEFPGRLRFVIRTRHAEFMAGRPPIPDRSTGINGTDQDPETTDQDRTRNDQDSDQDTVDTDQEDMVTPRTRWDSSDTALLVLQAVAETPKSREELLDGLRLSAHTDNARKHIRPLLDAGWIEMTLPDTPTSRNQRYRITAAGGLELRARRKSTTSDG
ncbi:MAG: putative DNA binding domain-containing protein [Propionibacteriaceae bacterium]|jgi:ATP-dependent DNA helicase RecG|nr:putative DNA binding domain-containing protein [Propionibacteriaceae bacterium]